MKRILLNVHQFLLIIVFFVFYGNVSAQCTITGTQNASTLNPNPCNTFTNCNGVLFIGDGSIATSLVMNADLDLSCLGPIQLIVNANAAIDFSGSNNKLTLAAGSSISFLGTGTLVPLEGSGKGCTGSERIIIGDTVIAACNGNSGIYEFLGLVRNGGSTGAAGVIGYNQTICSGSKPTAITSLKDGTGSSTITYEWESNAGGSFTKIPNANLKDYSPPFLTATTIYRRRTVTSGPTYSDYTNEVTITVNPLPTASISANNGPICSGANATFTLTGTSGAVVTYNINGGSNTTATLTSGTATVALIAATSNQTLNLVSINNPTTSCNQTLSGSLTVTVNATPTIAAISTPAALCSGGSLNPTAPTVTANGSTVTASGWQLETAVASNTYSNLTVPYTVAFADNGKRIRYYATNTCGTTNSNVVTLTVNPLPSAPLVGTITDVTCSSTTGSVVLSGLPSGSWTINQSNGTTNTTYFGSGANYTVTGLAVGNYTFTVNNGTCTSASTVNVPIVDTSSTTWDGSSWSKGAPDATKNIIIASSSGAPFAANLTACSLTINTGVIAIVPSGVTLTITNAVTTNGQLIFENNASLVQTTNAVNTGAIEYRRTSSPMKNFDFTYWSSPVTGQTAKLLSPNTLWDKYFRYNPATGWVLDAGEMKPGVGFIIRTPKPGTYGAPYRETVVMPYAQPVAFKGVPNNGDYSFSAGAGEFNLLGNPYPSALDADKFIIANNAIIKGALYFWTHNTPITNNKYTANDYATYTLTGGTGTVGNFDDKNNNGIMDPGEEVAPNKPRGKIAAGQSFFVENAAAGVYMFTNAMRVGGNNSQFYKQANTKKTATIEKNRVWLNLTNSEGAFKQLLVGYITGATNDWDNLYDGPTFDGQVFVDFYSINQGQNLTVQGRALPFSETDIVPLGYRSTIAGTFDISIDNRDGALANQAIWLEDKKTNTLHELSKGKYTFTAINGVENDRFVLKYTNANKNLGNNDNEIADKSLSVSVKNKKITLTSTAEAITQVQLFDLLGRKVYDKSKINAQEWSILNLPSSEQTLIVKTTLANGAISSKKIIY